MLKHIIYVLHICILNNVVLYLNSINLKTTVYDKMLALISQKCLKNLKQKKIIFL